MILLLKKVDGEFNFYLTKEKCTVGRKLCDLLITNDQSISRQHAVLTIKNGSVTLIDQKSKYCTYINGQKVKPNDPTVLVHGDVVKFGAFNSVYKFEAVNFVTTGTGLSETQKSQLNKLLLKLGGTYTHKWSEEVTHLTISTLSNRSVTAKVLLAIIKNVPLVTPNYWKHCVNCLETNEKFPDIKQYKPDIVDPILNNINLEFKSERFNLFDGKLFVFQNSKMKNGVQEVIEKTGGECISWEETQLSIEEIESTNKELVLVSGPEGEKSLQNSSITLLLEHLSKHKKRIVPLIEISLAILQCSCEKHCNPNFDRAEKVFASKENNDSDIVPLPPTQTEFMSCKSEVKEEEIISETYGIAGECDEKIDIEHHNIDFKEETNETRKRVAESEIENPFKKVKIETKTEIMSDDDIFEIEDERADVNHVLNPDKEVKKSEKRLGGSVNENPFKKKKIDLVEDSDDVIEIKDEEDLPQGEIFTGNKISNPFLTKNVFKKNNTLSRFLSKSSSLSISTSNNTSLTQKPSQTIKRRASEELEEDMPEINQNPFAFKKPKPSKKGKNLVKNPFAKTNVEQTNTNSNNQIFTSTMIESQPCRPSLTDISINQTTRSGPISWLSKETAISTTSRSQRDLDEEICQIIELFKEKAQVEIVTMNMSIASTTRPNLDCTDSSLTNGRRNFKKFVKVRPKRPQRTVIDIGKFVIQEPSSTKGICTDGLDYYEAQEIKKQWKKDGKKIFNL